MDMREGRSRLHRRSRLLIALVVPAILAGVAGCTGQHPSTAASSAPKDATFVMGVAGIPPQLDYQPFNGNGTRFVHFLLNSYLFNYNVKGCTTGAPTTTNLVGQLAKSWKASADMKTVDVKLANLKSQYGNPLTSEDVLWSLQRGFAISGSGSRTMSLIGGLDKTNPVTIVSPSEFKLNFALPTPESLAAFTVPGTDILDATEVKKHVTADDPWAMTWMQTHSAGFGAYYVSDMVANDSITMTANPGWTGAMGNVKKVVLKQIADPAAAAQLLQAGSINFTNNVSWSQYKSFATSTKVTTYACNSTGRDFLALQEKYAPLADVKVRQAISYALDRDSLIKGAYAGYAKPALTGWISTSMPKGAKADTASYNLKKAKQLMAQSSVPDGFDLTLNTSVGQPGTQVTQLAILIQSQLAKIGITVKINTLASADELVNDSHAQQYQAMLFGEDPPMPSILYSAFLLMPISPNGTWNFNNDDYNATFAALQNSNSTDDFDANVTKLANLNISAMPAVWIAERDNMMAMTKNVTGMDGALGLAGAQVPMPNHLTITK
jgi:peptide/nickel transport system substrate-binding protein